MNNRTIKQANNQREEINQIVDQIVSAKGHPYGVGFLISMLSSCVWCLDSDKQQDFLHMMQKVGQDCATKHYSPDA